MRLLLAAAAALGLAVPAKKRSKAVEVEYTSRSGTHTVKLPAGDLCILGQAGISDRADIYSVFGEIGLRYDKTIYVPARPCTAFDPRHNFGERISCDIRWDAYLSFPPNVRPRDNDQACARIDNARARLLGKILLIGDNNIRHRAKISCSEFKFLNLTAKSYNFVQIRRGDVLNDHRYNNKEVTSVEHVAESLRRDHDRSLGLAYTTNERDPRYLKRLDSAMRSVVQNATFVDPALWHPHCEQPRARTPNNYCVFCAAMQLAKRARRFYKFGGHVKPTKGGS